METWCLSLRIVMDNIVWDDNFFSRGKNDKQTVTNMVPFELLCSWMKFWECKGFRMNWTERNSGFAGVPQLVSGQTALCWWTRYHGDEASVWCPSEASSASCWPRKNQCKVLYSALSHGPVRGIFTYCIQRFLFCSASSHSHRRLIDATQECCPVHALCIPVIW